ncbi:hypothetical protein BST81_13695 [Leptolyngbya sp. 'hensonii']|uniref:hypothetical protein n=1 Tax=Leptolyngbya sp. 'hensonii' TaxID=1922337 RepID=UPI00094FC5C6|nr:hypothetical protein [Leptolyngbya sp. 'hensonii']OLP18207.1 hypothetical protein BST81_13695 [Leptolyngbya sp. 'hensonii']
MKGFIHAGLSALLLATGVGMMAVSAPQAKADADSAPIAESAMVFNFNTPTITNSGVRNNTHFIRIMVIGMSLKDVMVSLPAQMERFEKVRVVDQSGREVAGKIVTTKNRVSVVFDRSVAPGGYLDIEFLGVRMNIADGDILLYQITAQREGLRGEIPIGTARVQLPNRG